MKILELYKNLITETEITSCVKNFGYELFGHELGGHEKNTGLENSYIRDINDFTDNMYGEEINPDLVKAFKTLKSCMKQYPEVLIPEKTKAYRGVTIPVKYFIENKNPIDTVKPFNYVYKASSQIQSWSPDFDIASTFGNQDSLNNFSESFNISNYQTKEARQELLQSLVSEKIRLAVVLEYVTNSNEFLFKSKYFRMLSRNSHEDEIIRIDNKPISVLAKFNDHEDVFLTMNSLKLIKVINYSIQEP
jgi:hypothetical protein